MRLRLSFVPAALAAGALAAGASEPAHAGVRHAPAHAAQAYQGRGGDQTESFSRKVRLGRNGRVTVSNVSGDITVTGGQGEDVSIEAVKRSRGGRDALRGVEIAVEDRGGRVDVQTNYGGRHENVSVDYTITVPATASVEVSSISGSLKVSGVSGAVRLSTVSGSATATDVPHLEVAKSVSGRVSLSGVAADGDVTVGSVSGAVAMHGVKARSLELASVSGDLTIDDARCDRLTANSVSGSVEYSGELAPRGRYDITTHSGGVRLALPGTIGFDLTANTFSGAIRSDFAMTVGGDASREIRGHGMSNHSIHGTVGDGSATLTIRTFSGNVVITKR